MDDRQRRDKLLRQLWGAVRRTVGVVKQTKTKEMRKIILEKFEERAKLLLQELQALGNQTPSVWEDDTELQFSLDSLGVDKINV